MKNLIIILLGIILLSGCDYLDIVPTETANESDAFEDREAARRYLYSCYSYIPKARSGAASLDLLTSDEVVTAFEHETFANFPQGNYTPTTPIISYWSTLFQGIRQCYLLIDNIDDVPDMDDSDRQNYKAEATFLVAYYHYLLIKCYGPTILVTSTFALDTKLEDYPSRSPYDECVQWVADKFDESVALGLPNSQDNTAFGRATKSAALAIKSRMLLYAASPQFNGGTVNYSDRDADDISSTYASFQNEDGTLLMPVNYDATKWQKAADATLAAINAAQDANIRLYQTEDVPASILQPEDSVEKALRMTITDRDTRETIWAETRKEGYYGLQRKSTPYNEKSHNSYNGVGPTMTMIKAFYTENGLPVDEDPAYDYDNSFEYSSQTDLSHGIGVTLNLNKEREPRFYAWIAYQNSYYEVQSYASDLNVSDDLSKFIVGFRKNDNCGIKTRTRQFSPSGYLNKKCVHPQFSRPANGVAIDYPWPIIRLAELYLNYAEALIEIGGTANLTTAKEYIDKVRERAGIPTVDEAWATTGVTLDQDKMRQIVRQERTIELYLEGHRFWDVRRWLLGTKYFNEKVQGMDYSQATDDGFFRVVDVNYTRAFRIPQNYLLPIPFGDTEINPKIIQNPGY
ncbi:RagB/SusD family nutrient uptake outer membrane protein [Sunxiuqinia sp. sy24]|uniref:RagB/SusD family nutrient uptake outer membrane protein n=1 Tax=Sunxiuqinia sp. sy24 TaxID=3461495 RepID=UPI0040465091